MNYVPVIARNKTNGIARKRDNIVAGQAEKKTKPKQEYILIPICTTDPLISQDPKVSEEDAEEKPTEMDESVASDKDGEDDQATRSEFKWLLQQEKQTENPNNTNSINTVSTPISTARSSCTDDDLSYPVNTVEASNAFEEHLFEQFYPFKNAFTLPPVSNVTPMDDIGIFGNAYDDEDVGAEADLNNLETTMNVSSIPTTRIDKDHPKDQIIRDFNSDIQTRRMTKISNEHAMKVCTLVNLPNGKRAIGTKWIFRNKKDERGIVVRNKARLVAQGSTQEERIDYDEVFAPVARIEAIRLFLAYASFMRFIVYQMDVKSAFLYGTIEKEVYVCQPPSFEDPQFPDKVYKVEKALYGLHQAPKAWYETLSTYLIKNGFRRGTIDKTLFIKKDKGLMHKRFQMSSMGELTFFLGLQVQQKKDGIFISQDKYVADILKKFDFATMKTASTPMEPNKALIKDEEADSSQVTPKISHLYAVKRIFRYLKGQLKLGLWYLRDSPFDLEAFSDSDYAGASLDRNPTTGDETVYKKWEDIMEMAATTASSLDAEPTLAKTVNGERQLQALVDKKKVIIKETSIRSDLHLEDACGTDCLPTATIFEELARMGCEKPSQKLTFYKAFFSPQWKFLIHTITQCLSAKTTAWNEFSKGGVKFLMYPRFVQVFINQQLGDMSHHTKIYVNPSHTKKIFANMKREGKDFSGRTPITIQPSTSKPQKKQSRRKQKKTIAVPHPSDSTADVPNKESAPTHSNDPLLSEKKEGLRTHKFRRLYKVGVTRRIEYLDDESLGAQKDASNQGRSIEYIDKDAEVSLVNETQGRSDDAEMFDTNALISNEVFAKNDMIEKAQDVIPKEISTAAVSPPVITESTATTAPSTIPKAKGITFRDAGESTTRTPTSVSSSSIKDKGKAKMDEPEVPLKKKGSNYS
ncbi:putative ribonuclease H-like domain-containing protein [Tanacetum coccineum]